MLGWEEAEPYVWRGWSGSRLDCQDCVRPWLRWLMWQARERFSQPRPCVGIPVDLLTYLHVEALFLIMICNFYIIFCDVLLEQHG